MTEHENARSPWSRHAQSGAIRPESSWQTDRLVARPPVLAEAGAIFGEYASDPEVAKYMTWRPHRDARETTAFVRRCEQVWIDGTAFPWVLSLKDGGALAGMIELRLRPPAVDIGYVLVRRWWKHGLMSEAVSAVVEAALAQPGIFRVWATCDVDNTASARLLERVGMQREGMLRRWILHPNVSDTPRDCYCYSIVR